MASRLICNEAVIYRLLGQNHGELVLGVCLIGFLQRLDAATGIGVGLVLQSAFTLALDMFAEARGARLLDTAQRTAHLPIEVSYLMFRFGWHVFDCQKDHKNWATMKEKTVTPFRT